jgi:hypothetical protein
MCWPCSSGSRWPLCRKIQKGFTRRRAPGKRPGFWRLWTATRPGCSAPPDTSAIPGAALLLSEWSVSCIPDADAEPDRSGFFLPSPAQFDRGSKAHRAAPGWLVLLPVNLRTLCANPAAARRVYARVPGRLPRSRSMLSRSPPSRGAVVACPTKDRKYKNGRRCRLKCLREIKTYAFRKMKITHIFLPATHGRSTLVALYAMDS